MPLVHTKLGEVAFLEAHSPPANQWPACKTLVHNRTRDQLAREAVHDKRPDDFLLTRKGNRRVLDFRQNWEKLCARAGLEDLLVHDLRRSAARNLRRAGVAESVVMEIGGWKTRSVFLRYDIVNSKDKKRAMEQLEQPTARLRG
jgi:integrase